jgi:ADP-ribose pyrophosphatase YjhB (NUDIX family)
LEVFFIFVKLGVFHDSETPADGQQVITACAFMHRNIGGAEKILLPKRVDTKKFLPGKYEIPGGHIEFGEDIEDGLKRGVKEEPGIEITLGDSFAVFTYTNEIKGSHSIEVVYFAQIVGGSEAITIEPLTSRITRHRDGLMRMRLSN